MTLKCKNPYFDENIDRKFVFLLYSVLIAKGINLGEKFDGLFISDNKVGILETHLDYEMAVMKEVSVYKAFEHCIPDGMRYNKELDKLVPDIMQWEKADNGGNHIAVDGTSFDTLEEALNHNYTLIATSSADEYCSEIKLDSDSPKQFTQKIQNHRDYNIGSSNYASMKIQPWDVWKDWKLDPWDADIIKRISRTKEIPNRSFEDARIEDYEKIKHICDEKIYQLKEKINAK